MSTLMSTAVYTNGEYMRSHPSWHVEDAPWKAGQVLRMIERHGLKLRSVAEVGCGTGAILQELQASGRIDCEFSGYEISPQAFSLCAPRANRRLRFVLGDICDEPRSNPDLILLMDVVEHVEDYLGFLRKLNGRSRFTILHVPLDLSIQSLLRSVPVKVRKSAGHLHYFTKELICSALEETGYRVLDHFYTGAAVDFPAKSLMTGLAKWPRKLLFTLNPDVAPLLFGGYSLLVLAE
jgi:SAM-dependent methyltransferase